MTDEEIKLDEYLQQRTIPLSPPKKQNADSKIPVISPLSQVLHKNQSYFNSISNSRRKFKENRTNYPSSTDYFNNNLNKCFENLSNLKEKMKGLNHSNTQKLLNKQFFSSQIQKIKEDYPKLKPYQESFQTEPRYCQEPSQYFTEETESYYVSNQILNKTNVDLKNQLKNMENQFEYNKSIQFNMKEMTSYIDSLKRELTNSNKAKLDLLSTINSFRSREDILSNEKKILNDKLEKITNAYNQLLNESRNKETIIIRLKNENETISNSNLDKGKDYETLTSKLSITENTIKNLKKTKGDYEELISNMKKTIQILTDNNMNQAVLDMKTIIQDKDVIIQSNTNLINQLQSRLDQYEQKDRQQLFQVDQMNKNRLNTDNDGMKNDIEIQTIKINQLYQLINDKDDLIHQLKDNYSFLNNAIMTIQQKQTTVLKELQLLKVSNIYSNQMGFSDSKESLLKNLKQNAQEINDMLINATMYPNKNNSNQLRHNRNVSMPRSENLISQDNNDSLKKSYDLSMNYDQLTSENEQLKTENKLLRSECEIANKKFNQILNNQSPMYLGTATSLQTGKMMTNNNLNTELNDILANNICLYRIYDSRRILRFDLAQKDYQIVEFIDYDSFDTNYNSICSIVLNTLDGFFVLTGIQNDILYYYNNEKITMSKVTKFTHNHSHGALILDEINSSIIALSGWHNAKVEKYTNTKLILSQYTSNNEKTTDIISLPDMTIERSESGYLYYNNDTIFAFFGYCYPKQQYIETVEYLLVNTSTRKGKMVWQTLSYKLNDNNTNTLIKAHGIAMINEDEVLILGGFNGLSETSVEKLLRFDIKALLFEEINRKLPNIDLNHCYNFAKESQFINYEDENNNMFLANIDEMDNVHIIETSSLNYDLFKFD